MYNKVIMKKYIILPVSLLVIMLVLAGQASAATVKAGERFRLGTDESVSENLYVGSGDINLAGEVLGDLIAGGGNVTLTGRNAKDVMIGGGSVNVLGATGEDLRVAGGNIIIGEDVGGDLVVVGGMVHVLSGVEVAGDVLVAGGAVIIDGNLAKDLTAMGGEVTVNGKVAGSVRVKSAEKLTIGSGAEIAGNLDYGSPREAVVLEGAKVGGAVNYTPTSFRHDKSAKYAMKGALLGLFTAIALVKLAILLAAALLLVHLFQNGLAQVAGEIHSNFWRELLRGLVVMVTVPAAAVILAMTVVGLIPAALAMLAYAALMLLATVYSGVFFGAWLSKRFSKTKELAVTWKTATLGLLALGLLGAVPFVGWIVDLAVMLASLGGLSNALHRRLWQ